MEKISFIFMVILAVGLVACDAKDQFNKPRTEPRTRIIGGEPAFDRDYKRSIIQKIEQSKALQ